MTIYNETIKLNENDLAIKLENLTNEECYEKYGLKRDEVVTHTVKFPNKYEVDIKCIVGWEDDSTTWYEGVIFTEGGAEVGCTDVEDSILGEWHFQDNIGNTYIVNVEV